MTFLGIDPGTETTGYGVVRAQSRGQRIECADYGCIRTSRKKTAGERLVALETELLAILKTHAPDAMAVESLFFFKNLKTAMPVSQARGVVLLVGTKCHIPIHEFTPLQVKMTITGYGNAEKIQVQRMVKELLKLKEIPKPDDAADALAIAVACSVASNNPLYAPRMQ
ncbi:MAG: crossover junction endodeoxyribonuclease RuvC [Candidatus Wildermuthbacteria bacterium RIFCSPHIGHO2_12_FULL_45_9]|uniref:Crossover junction endodeoxyribonuclease RuvC n=1 Tax=Candidatus Wildermuthbacteria bacterium RIFCSPHIGHO2_02_FULL_45_25 TaxID=1802450 RepID=A0A1G2R0D3_9BACT|nr:MAG: crossover junction endodeoxyribonuclease RuvC [Candidatus Wildermuthbacteria bacterium RIFCSPHIGHO2_01_FULL_45_20]OHA66354.1 MAG: crossover junction endodeoxyribonuclease RuvC [Candidatus Wildermuthbacteria bacterium RIFCSPHIGHO2_02_FULL_45_25]OHA71994.1 MAG: crossover junction endodeoxyribonuclease RuvC [Candidatus Wildermuthbacteria bacterium RIFCSPHIGHO2_12_FULL_45_9]